MLKWPPPTDILNVQLHIEKFPLTGGWRVNNQLATTYQANEKEREKKKKKACWSEWVRLKHSLTINLTPSVATGNYKGTQNPGLLSEEPRVWFLHQVLHLSDGPPKASSFENQWGYPWDHKAGANWKKKKKGSLRANAPGLTHPEDHNRGSWLRGTQNFMWKRFICSS